MRKGQKLRRSTTRYQTTQRNKSNRRYNDFQRSRYVASYENTQRSVRKPKPTARTSDNPRNKYEYDNEDFSLREIFVMLFREIKKIFAIIFS